MRVPGDHEEPRALRALYAPRSVAVVGASPDKEPDYWGARELLAAGGVLAEVLRDARVALAPVTQAGARELLRDLRAAALLDGVRGRPPLDADAAADALVALTLFAAAHLELAAVEIDPLLVPPRGALGLDARIVLHDDEDAAGGVAAGRSQKGVL